MDRKPIVYKKHVQTRFSDIDRYQHVNTMWYPEYVFTSRFDFLKDRFGIDPDHFEKNGIGFYNGRMEVKFIKPIPASETSVLVTSRVKNIDRALLSITFEISEDSGEHPYATGEFDFYMIDLKSQKPVAKIPEFIESLVFEPVS